MIQQMLLVGSENVAWYLSIQMKFTNGFHQHQVFHYTKKSPWSINGGYANRNEVRSKCRKYFKHHTEEATNVELEKSLTAIIDPEFDGDKSSWTDKSSLDDSKENDSNGISS